jgi:hypothetical protein
MVFCLLFDGKIYDGGFNVSSLWRDDLQPLFSHQIDFESMIISWNFDIFNSSRAQS